MDPTGTDGSQQARHNSYGNDDDYELISSAVSDGFRPTNHAAGNSSYTPSTSRLPTTATSIPNFDPLPKLHDSAFDRPSSTSKPPRPHDSLTLRNDGSSAARNGQFNNSTQVLSDPSHPYDMYPQRTLSNATSSASPAGHGVGGINDTPRGPTHPYGLYTQNTTNAEEIPQQQHIPVGFNSSGNTYHRQLGPDGEEAGDLMGPMGHTEQLPPYTRYPEQAFVRRRSVDAGHAGGTPSIQLMDGAGGLGVATRNPEFSSTSDDLAGHRSRPSIRSADSSASRHDINTAARDVAEKPRMTKWQRRAKKKLWGIVPYWAVCLVATCLVLMAVVMGSVIGTVLSHDDGSDYDDGNYDDVDPTPTSSSNVEPLTTVPASLVPLGTGYFVLPPLQNYRYKTPNVCFNDTTQSHTWSCDMKTRFYAMNISIDGDAAETGKYELSLLPNDITNATDAYFPWGTWPKSVSSSLTLVDDTWEGSYGPAWWLRLDYNKTVLVDDGDFSTKTKRDSNSWWNAISKIDISHFEKKTDGAKPGDKPWICTWNATTLEVFLYPNQNVSKSSIATAPSDMPSPDNPKTSGHFWTARGLFEIAMGPSSTTAVTGPKPTGSDTTYKPPTGKVQGFPNIAKIMERRLYDNATTIATCHQIEISEDGKSSKDVLEADGSRREVFIKNKADPSEDDEYDEGEDDDEEDSREYDNDYTTRDVRPQTHRRKLPRNLRPRDDDELSDCGCIWLYT